MNKRFLSIGFVLIFSFVSLFGQTKELNKIVQATEKYNGGYFYSSADLSLIRLSLSDKGLRIAVCSLDFSKNKIYEVSFVQEKYNDYSKDEFDNFLKNMEQKDGMITSYVYRNEKYQALPKEAKEDVVNVMKNLAVKNLEKYCGEYIDESNRVRFILTKADDGFYVKKGKRGQKFISEKLELYDGITLLGKTVSVELKDEKITVKTSGEKYVPKFDLTTKKNLTISADKSQRKNATISLQQGRFTKSDAPFSISNYDDYDDFYVSFVNEYGYYDSSHIESYDLYLDDDGYKKMEFKDRKFIIIDGEHANIIFEYNGDSLASDKEAVKKYFSTSTKDWMPVANMSGPKYINGKLYFQNIKASSSLKDKHYNYLPENILEVYDAGYETTRWVMNNIPWVEGKPGNGIGETIEFDLIPGTVHEFKGNASFDLIILNGYVDPLKPYLFKENNRIKKAIIETEKEVKVVTFNDCVEFTSVHLNGKHVKITIQEVYQGTKYQDTCISAISLWDGWWEK